MTLIFDRFMLFLFFIRSFRSLSNLNVLVYRWHSLVGFSSTKEPIAAKVGLLVERLKSSNSLEEVLESIDQLSDLHLQIVLRWVMGH